MIDYIDPYDPFVFHSLLQLTVTFKLSSNPSFLKLFIDLHFSCLLCQSFNLIFLPHHLPIQYHYQANKFYTYLSQPLNLSGISHLAAVLSRYPAIKNTLKLSACLSIWDLTLCYLAILLSISGYSNYIIYLYIFYLWFYLVSLHIRNILQTNKKYIHF